MKGCSCVALLFISGLAMLIFGGVSTYEGLRYRHPVAITYQEFVRQKPHGGWFRISGGILDVQESGYRIEDGQEGGGAAVNNASELFIPLQDPKVAAGLSKDKTIHVMVQTSDPAIVATFKELHTVAQKSEKEQDAYFDKNMSRVFVKRDFQGMVMSALNHGTKDLQATDKAYHDRLAPDYAFFKEGEEPSLFGGFVEFIGGLLLLLILLVVSLSHLAKSQPDPVTLPDSVSPSE